MVYDNLMKKNNTVSIPQKYRQLADAAVDFGVSAPTLLRWSDKAGATHRIGRVIMIDVEKINDYIGEH